MSTGLVTDASAGSTAASAVRVGSPSGSTLRPSASQASAQRIAGPPTFVTIATRLPLRQRLAAEHGGHVEHLVDGVGADDARVPEECVDGRVGRGEQRAGVRGGGALPAAVRPLLTAITGLAAVTRRAMRPNLRGLPNDSR